MTSLSLRPVRFQGSPPPPPSASSKPDPAPATSRVSSETLPSKAQPAKVQPGHWQAHAMTSLKGAAKIPSSKPSFQIEPLQPVLTSPKDINEANMLEFSQRLKELITFFMAHNMQSFLQSTERLAQAIDQDETIKKEAENMQDYLKDMSSLSKKLHQEKNIPDDLAERVFGKSTDVKALTALNEQEGEQEAKNSSDVLATLVNAQLETMMVVPHLDKSNATTKPITDRMAMLVSRDTQGELAGHVMLQPASLLFDPQGTYAVTDPTAWIHNLVVHTDERQQGLGTALIQKSLETAKEKGYQHALLSVNPKKPWLETWYQTLGFAPIDDHTPETIRDTVRFAQKTVAQSPLAKALDGDRRFLWKSL